MDSTLAVAADLSQTIRRGGLQPPHGLRPPTTSEELLRERQRTLAVKIGLDLGDESDLALYRRLRELSWQATQYGNNHIRGVWAEAEGFRIDPSKGDLHDITKHIRRREKGELSGDSYSAIEREAKGMWSRNARRILAGGPLPQFRDGRALSVRGHKNENESGVRVREEDGRFWVDLRAQAATCEGGGWLRLPVAKGTEIDEFQGPLLRRMASWDVAVRKATVSVNPIRRRVVVRLSFAEGYVLPPVGERRAQLGPISSGTNRLTLRSESDTLDYTSRLNRLLYLKDNWDLIRRRVLCQIGRRRGGARTKRKVLARMSPDERITTELHTWSSEIVTWCAKQGMGYLDVIGLGAVDWPAYRFCQMLKYKGEDVGVLVSVDVDPEEPAGARAVKAEILRERKRSTRMRRAAQNLKHETDKIRRRKR